MKILLLRRIFGSLFVLALLPSILVAKGAAKPVDNYYNFTIPWDDSLPTIFDMSEKLNGMVAGSHGYVSTQGSKLFFEDGTPAYFWGINVAFSSGNKTLMPPNKNIARALVKKWSKYGINHVRFIGFDGNAPEVYKKLIECPTCKSKTLDKFDYLISELRKAGIYYSLSINNNSNLQLDMNNGLLKNRDSKSYKKYRHVRLYDEKAVDIIEEWFRLFYSHINPYTGLSYAKDPANIYTSAANEDSIFYTYHHNFSMLTDDNIKILTNLFNTYLAKRYVNTRTLKQKWNDKYKLGLLPNENLENNNVSIILQKNIPAYTKQRIIDTMRFLYEIDTNFANRIRNVLVNLGYKGLFTTTNNWGGYGSLIAAHDAGNYIETHGYIDPPKRSKLIKDTTIIRNDSYLSNPFSKGALGDSNSLISSFASALVDRPFILGEWNQTVWSNYSYEAPLVVTVYSAFQDYAGLNIFNYFNYPNPKPTRDYSLGPFAVNGNPIFLSLSPTLALAFRKNYITSPKDSIVIDYATNIDDFLFFAANHGMKKTHGNNSLPLSIGFTHKLRKRLIGEKDTRSKVFTKTKDNKYISSTSQIFWDHSKKGRTKFSVNTPKFQALAGIFKYIHSNLRNLSINLNGHGVLTAISLDDLELDNSNKTLLTLVSSYRNSGMIIKNVLGGGYKIASRGKSPVQLLRTEGSIRFKTKNKGIPQVSAILVNGKEVKIPFSVIDTGSEYREVTFDVGQEDTPWYTIIFSDMAS